MAAGSNREQEDSMPAQVRPVTDERDALAAYVAQQQDAFRAVIYGLTDEQAGQKPTPSALSVGALVKHVTHVQRSWLTGVLAVPELPVDERPMGERHAEWEDALSWLEGDTVKEALAHFDDTSARVLQAIREVGLDTAYPIPPAPWNPTDVTHWSVRWVWLHLIEELARHAGHADIIREAIDGATMYELIAGLEGWPESDWLKPWRPRE
jgi:hypothetical protein